MKTRHADRTPKLTRASTRFSSHLKHKNRLQHQAYTRTRVKKISEGKALRTRSGHTPFWQRFIKKHQLCRDGREDVPQRSLRSSPQISSKTRLSREESEKMKLSTCGEPLLEDFAQVAETLIFVPSCQHQDAKQQRTLSHNQKKQQCFSHMLHTSTQTPYLHVRSPSETTLPNSIQAAHLLAASCSEPTFASPPDHTIKIKSRTPQCTRTYRESLAKTWSKYHDHVATQTRNKQSQSPASQRPNTDLSPLHSVSCQRHHADTSPSDSVSRQTQRLQRRCSASSKIRSWLEILLGTSINCSTTCGTETSTICLRILFTNLLMLNQTHHLVAIFPHRKHWLKFARRSVVALVPAESTSTLQRSASKSEALAHRRFARRSVVALVPAVPTSPP